MLENYENPVKEQNTLLFGGRSSNTAVHNENRLIVKHKEQGNCSCTMVEEDLLPIGIQRLILSFSGDHIKKNTIYPPPLFVFISSIFRQEKDE